VISFLQFEFLNLVYPTVRIELRDSITDH